MIIPVSASTVLLLLPPPIVMLLPLVVILIALALLTPECNTGDLLISIPIPPAAAAVVTEPESDLDRFGLEEDRVRSLLLSPIARNFEGLPLDPCSFRFSILPPYENSCGTLVFESRYIMASGGETLNLRCTKSVSLRRRLLSCLIEGGLSIPSLIAPPCTPSPLVVGGASFDNDDDDVIATTDLDLLVLPSLVEEEVDLVLLP